MMMTKQTLVKRLVLMVIALYMGVNAYAQFSLKEAQKEFELNRFSMAKPLFEKAYSQKKTIAAARGAAQCCLYVSDYVGAATWYSKVMAMSKYTSSDVLNYAAVLMSNVKYEEAKGILLSNSSRFTIEEKVIADRLMLSCTTAAEWINNPAKVTIRNMEALNSKSSDWGTAIYKGRLIFASNRGNRNTTSNVDMPFFANPDNYIGKKEDLWTGDEYYHLYSAMDSSAAVFWSDSLVPMDYHTSMPTFTGNNGEVFFARTRMIKKRPSAFKNDIPYTIHTEIFSSSWNDWKEKWSDAIPFPYNDALKYSISDPYVSPDGQWLYFVSDIKGKGQGGLDIYYCRRRDNGEWTPPVNMGKDINTAGDERTPFMLGDSVIYFSSNGHIGMGGLDIYKASKLQEGIWTVSNMQYPINSPQDDFAPYFYKESKGYFSSNRVGGKGEDDIYSFDFPQMIRKPTVIRAKFVSTKKGKEVGMPDIKVKLRQVGHLQDSIQEGITGKDGIVEFTVEDTTKPLSVTVEKDGYITKSSDLNTATLKPVRSADGSTMEFTMEMDKLQINKSYVLKNIYYSFNKSNLRSDALPELKKLLRLLRDNPGLRVEISSHTDSRGSAEYNEILSQARAESVVEYLVEHGISRDRLIAKGYGFTQLRNKCAPGVKCTSAQHQLNRRTEFRIIGIDLESGD